MQTKITKSRLAALQRSSNARGAPVFIYDTQLRGFGARVGPNSVSFFVEYRLGGRRGRNRRMTLGRLGELTVEGARRKAQSLRVHINDGVDVLEAREAARRKYAGTRFEDAVERYLALNAKPGRYWAEVERLLKCDDVAPLKKRALQTLTTVELIAIIDQVTTRSPSAARTLFAALRPFFAWCVPRGFMDASALAGVRPPAVSPARDRVLTDTELRAFWVATEGLGYPFAMIYRLLLLTGQRRAEVAAMAWSELDLEAGTWTLPSARTKNNVPHVVDLVPQAIALLHSLSRGSSDFVFTTTGRTPPSGFSRAKRKLDQEMRGVLGTEPAPWRVHDLRRTAASGMAALGFAPHVIERILNHRSGAQGGLVGVYQRHDYRNERRAALLAWDAKVREIVTQRPSGHNNVVALPMRARDH